MPEKKQRTLVEFRIYRAADGFRWRGIHRNGKIIADSGEAYTSKRTLRRTLDRFLVAMWQNDMEVIDQTKGQK